jgi:2-C-methyl-D-erythritol 4-phosphate cytidylyltransferase
MTKRPYTAAIIAAGGSSVRCGSDKLEFLLGGETVLTRVLRVFDSCADIDEIVVVTRPDRVSMLSESVAAQGLNKPCRVVAGDSTRTESVRNGAAAVSPQTEVLCIHDGARPFVTQDLITCTIAAAVRVGAATAAVPEKYTVKVADADGMVLATPPRETLWEIQTPQCFSRGLYMRASEHAEQATDDCVLFERMGYPVQLVRGEERNIKITAPEDLLVARAFWEAYGQCE